MCFGLTTSPGFDLSAVQPLHVKPPTFLSSPAPQRTRSPERRNDNLELTCLGKEDMTLLNSSSKQKRLVFSGRAVCKPLGNIALSRPAQTHGPDFGRHAR